MTSLVLVAENAAMSLEVSSRASVMGQACCGVYPWLGTEKRFP